MGTATLRRSGGSLIMVIPPAYAEQNHLTAGDTVKFNIEGQRLTLSPQRKRYDAASLLAETPAEFFSDSEWDKLPATGQEVW
ncbi:AbrB/MazE/SpoVT family DNA-binding domain-containing protein [uncultured Deefgea sp.]|uniref:AbrB/MazE/SpoVT family DNA-binding domain-containing protein n=1 Tax=uncultured Deefgea sp. TaxID=1304914 RepID=UPI0025948063|nr:AbrB/MazE/SpoVT family DNA-binding domain-containing protein [uncultured Deefgea sp.]